MRQSLAVLGPAAAGRRGQGVRPAVWRAGLVAALSLALLMILSAFSLLASAQAQEAGNAAAADTAAPDMLAAIRARGELRVGVNPLYKPFSFEKDGRRVGVDIDIARLLAKKLGVKARIVVPKAFGDLLPMLERGEVDIVLAGMSITFERALKVNFTRPYFETGLSILANKGRLAKLGVPLVRDYETLKARLEASGRMGRLRIAVTRGKAPERIVPQYFPGAQVLAFDSNEAAAEAVLKGEADLMVHDEMFLKVWLHDNAARAGFLMVVFERPFKPDYYGMAVRKGDVEFVRLLDTFILAELKANGRLMAFLGRYIPVRAQVSVRAYTITEDYYGGD